MGRVCCAKDTVTKKEIKTEILRMVYVGFTSNLFYDPFAKIMLQKNKSPCLTIETL
jgi:hypothetical protein